MDETWTLTELVAESQTRLEALPAPKNGQVRAVPDERTIRYYAAIGLLDRPAAMRGRTALYGRRHLAQVVAIKRMQSAGKSLAEIQSVWPTLDDATLARMTGVELVVRAAGKTKGARAEFWKRGAEPTSAAGPSSPTPAPTPLPRPTSSAKVLAAPPTSTQAGAAASAPVGSAPVELRLELAPGFTAVVALADDSSFSLSPADVRALRAAAAPLVTELAKRGLITRTPGTLEEP